MGVQVDETQFAPGGQVAEVVAIRRFVPAADNDRDCPGSQNPPDHLRQRCLRLLKGAGDADVPGIEQRIGGEIDLALAVPGCQAVKPVADRAGSLAGAGASVVTAHAFVLRETDQHNPAGLQCERTALREFRDLAEARVVGTPDDPCRPRDRLKPRKPRVRA